MKLKSTYLLAIFLFVISCAPQVTVTPEATATITITSTPPPTKTISPTETATPAATATAPVSETAISTTIEGNPFSEMGIELKMLNNITLSTEGDDLSLMADILDQLAAEGKITVKPITEQRGAMQLGPSADGKPDLVIQPESAANDWWGPMYMVQDYDLRTFRWQDVTTRPVLIGFNNADGGVIFASIMVDGSGVLKTTGWLLATEWLDQYGGIGDVLEYKNIFRKRMPVPLDVADVDACVEYVMDEAMRSVCEEIVNNRVSLRAAYAAMVNTGQVQLDLRSGKLITLLGFTLAHR